MKTFTLDEAQWLLPVLQGLLKTAMDGKRTIESVEAELTAVNHRIFLSGGMLPDITHLAQRRAARDKAALAAKDALAEIDAMGVQVKDLDMGLLIFPARWRTTSSCSAGRRAKPKSPIGTGWKKASADANPSPKPSVAPQTKNPTTVSGRPPPSGGGISRLGQ
jgi:hypothetical protein